MNAVKLHDDPNSMIDDNAHSRFNGPMITKVICDKITGNEVAAVA